MTQTNPTVDDNLTDPVGQEDPNHTEVDEKNIETEQAQTSDEETQEVDYKAKAAESFKESMKLKQQKETLEEDNLYYKNLHDVAKDSQKLHDIAKSNPQMADRITKEYEWGDTYQEAVSATSEKSEDKSEVDPKQAARETFFEIRQEEEAKSIEEFEVNFFIENGISMNSPKYKAIMNTYKRFPSKTLKDAQDLLTMSHTKHNPNVQVELPAPNGDFGSKGKVKSEFTEKDKQIMEKHGWDVKKMREFKASPYGSWSE